MPTRIRRPRTLSPRLIIACEGQKAEYHYFLALNNRLKGRQRAALKVVPGSGSNANSVVEAAIRQREDDRSQQKFFEEDGDKAYAITDVEPHDATKKEPLEKAISLATQQSVVVFLSNPSFEVWLLCHLVTAAVMKRSFQSPGEAKRELEKRLGSAQPIINDWTIMDRLASKASEAVRVAREVHAHHHKSCTDIRGANACTDVYRLVAFLLGESDTPP